jgi:4-hydroxyphenylpyruvate dioxygenase
MAPVESLRIKRLEAIHYYVHDLTRSRRFYGDLLDLPEIAHSKSEVDQRGHQRAIVFEAGSGHIVVSAPFGEGSGRASRFLRNHPDGIGTLIFEVEDAAHAFKLLDARGGTPIQEVQHARDDGGEIRYFSITTPLGDTTFRFVERRGYRGMFPGFELVKDANAKNRFGLAGVDHVTSNFQTMSPALLWFEHVLGFSRYWDVEFHTADVAPEKDAGSGLRSVVMRDPVSGVKFANNEPRRPFFTASQINIFNRDHRGDGVQHVAFQVNDLISAVQGMRERGVEFMDTPDTYYDVLEERMAQRGVGKLEESVDVLKQHRILVDGSERGQYMLQIFLKDSQALYKEPEAGPFFYELIQRKGDLGFGAGNFRALFESIERDQHSHGAA